MKDMEYGRRELERVCEENGISLIYLKLINGLKICHDIKNDTVIINDNATDDQIKEFLRGEFNIEF